MIILNNFINLYNNIYFFFIGSISTLLCLITNLYLYLYIYFRTSKSNIYKLEGQVRYLNVLYKSKYDFVKGKIVNWNVHYSCDFYNYNRLIEILKFLKKENAEVYVIQEFLNLSFSDNRDLIDYMMEYLNIENYIFVPIYKYNNCSYGNLILCQNPILKRKILNFKLLNYKTRNICISIKTKVNNKEIWINNTYFNSDITGFLQKFQSTKLLKHIEENEGEQLIMGDFNCPSNYKGINMLKKNLIDISDKDGFNKTFPSIYPTAKLDYVFYYGEGKNNIEMKIDRNYYSDHLPLIIHFE
jgi:endonuclease/exonuclease/phosphatase family metal-dependent hydrolase